MRVAVLADIHGNLPALNAVLDDIDRLPGSVDAIVLNGDIAVGPRPHETLDRLAALGERAVWVSGNGDRWLVEAFDGRFRPTGNPYDAVVEWAAGQLTAEHRDRLAGMPRSVALDVDGVGPVAFHHATARDDNEMLLVDSSLAHFRAAFSGVPESTVVVGHTHMPFDRLADRRRVVNPGSVGMPYGHTGAAWALLGPDVVLRRTAFDTRAAAASLSTSTMPGIGQFIEENVLSTHSDAEALAVFRSQEGGPGAVDRGDQVGSRHTGAA